MEFTKQDIIILIDILTDYLESIVLAAESIDDLVGHCIDELTAMSDSPDCVSYLDDVNYELNRIEQGLPHGFRDNLIRLREQLVEEHLEEQKMFLNNEGVDV